MDNRKKDPAVEGRVRLAFVVLAIVLALSTVVLVMRDKNTPARLSIPAENENAPTCMYFVTKSDEGYAEYMAALAEVEKEYVGKVSFAVTDIDEEPSAKEEYETYIALGTPALVMMTADGKTPTFSGECTTIEMMTENIESALKSE